MKFYKTTYNANSPTKTQVNVSTNTDYLVGFECQVNGEKLEITAENVKLIEKEGDVTFNALSGTSNEDFDFALAGAVNTWTTKNEISLTSNATLSSDATNWIPDEKNGTKLDVTMFNGTIWENKSGYLDFLRFVVDGVTYTLRTPPKNRIIDRDPTVTYWQIGDNVTGNCKSVTIPEGTAISSITFYDAGTDTNKSRTGSFAVEQHFVDCLTPNTTVNGIPAIQLASGATPEDKCYTVEFSGSNTNVTWEPELSAYGPVNGDLFEFKELASNKFRFTLLKEITIKAPFAAEGGKYIDLGNDFTNLAAKDKYGNSVFGGELAYFGNYLQLSSATDGVFNVLYLTTSDLATIGYKKSSNYVISNTGRYVESVTLKPGDIIQINKNSGFSDPSPRFWYFQVGKDAFDHKFKLFVNEKDSGTGDVNPEIPTYETISLSGTYDDDTTFNYNILVK